MKMVYKMNEDGGQKIFDFLMDMIRLKEQMQTDEIFSREKRISLTMDSYIKEYCTIRLNAGRQVGHTTALMKLIEHFSLQKKKILVVAPALRFIQQLQRKMKIIGTGLEQYVSFETESTVMKNTVGKSFNFVIYDNFDVQKSFIEETGLVKHLSILGSQSKNFMMVLLG